MLRSLLNLTLFIIMVSFASAGQFSPVPTVTPVEGTAPLEVTISWEHAPGGAEFIEQVLWFVDGDAPFATAEGATQTITFDEPGTYIVILATECKDEYFELCTDDGQSIQKNQTITIVVEGPEPVEVDATADRTECNAPFNASFTSNVSNNVTSVSWQVLDSEGNEVASGIGSTLDYEFTEPGEFTVVLTGQSDQLVTETDEIIITVYESLSAELDLVTDQVELYIATDNGDDTKLEAVAEFQNNSNPIGGGQATTFVWDFGDGSDAVTTNDFTTNVSHNYTEAGEYTVTLTISNECGTDEITTTVVIDDNTSVQEIADENITFMTRADGHTFEINEQCVGCDLTIDVIDVNGNFVANVYNGNATSQNIPFNTSSLAEGFYMYRIQLGDKFKTVKFNKIK